MTLRPAYQATLTHGSDAVVLRASLRAAVALDQLPGGFPAIVTEIAGQNYTTTRAVIRASATDPVAAERLLMLDGQPLRPFMDKAAPACLALIAHILPAPDKTTDSAPTEGTGKPWAEHFSELFSLSTGWLGWPPEVVWNASCDELTAAFTAHVERLVAMNGGTTDEPEDSAAKDAQRQANIAAGLDPDFDRNALRALQGMS